MNAVLMQWLLNLAIDFPVSFNLLPKMLNGNHRKPSPVNVRPLFGFTLAQGVDRLIELADMGLVTFKQEISEGETRSILASELTPLEGLLESQVRMNEITFELTQSGGDRWDRKANPACFEMKAGLPLPLYETKGWGGAISSGGT